MESGTEAGMDRTISVAAPSPALADAVAALVNDVYDTTEGPLWSAGVQRTDAAEVLALMESRRFLVALEHPDDPASAVGAVCVKALRPDVAEFGMLGVAPRAAGRGLGEALVRAAEQHAADAGFARMEIVVIRPAAGTLPAKELLSRWYPRLGYRLVSTAPADADVLPTLDLLVTDCLIDTYSRTLAQSTELTRPELTRPEPPRPAQPGPAQPGPAQPRLGAPRP